MDSGVSLTPVAEGGAVSAETQPKLQLPVAVIVWFLALLVLLFLPVLIPMVSEFLNDETMGYGFFVPLVSGYVVWLDRERILAAPVS
jgi:positive regulator of sigma E activity